MEENKEEKMSYEQLEQAAMQMQNKLMMIENKLRNVDFVSIRLNWLFKVVEFKEVFDAEFVSKCTKEVKELLSIEEENKEN